VREIDPFIASGQAHLLRLQVYEAKCAVVVDDDLDGQLVMSGSQKFAHQHVEAAIAAKRDYLPRFVEHLDAVRLPHRRADGAIVEGTDDALRTALPDVIGGPQRVQARIEHKDGVLGRKFAHRACHCLWMDSVRASAETGLAIELFIPLPALTAHPFEKAIVL